jgi:hypothetical protein
MRISWETVFDASHKILDVINDVIIKSTIKK